ncbi:GNAT family N-acetyltransferase [Pelagovum pacificum]|uniref:GNAT family N-acetyltransferase n=1 Tax=Pelagovum pacificum TaxID=2588711 RepID=A0A5C5GCC3_9RHOB|nr:GNAT family N-acetyltransferase [Pelagovum pacificum]QQA42540.1 GNAT family N-acetyltransferase [Pelagovum pacificum]TNY31624.1 GNAT family N-acetyltransferase [Pelagovum pacificum]
MRRVTTVDLPAVEAFLRTRLPLAMFQLSNLDRFGLDGDHAYAPRMWVAERDGQVSDVLTVATNGTVMPALTSGDWQAAAEVLDGMEITAVLGPAQEARPMMKAAGLDGGETAIDNDEPQFALDLAQLVIPDGPGTLRPLAAADRDQMIRWRADYEIEALGSDAETAEVEGRASYEGYIAAGSHRVLMEGGTALATTGFNARLPDAVQIGGVYTPPELRRKGHARRAVALHLEEARDGGATEATLFAASENAARAYIALGFERIGDWTLCLYRTPQVARA